MRATRANRAMRIVIGLAALAGVLAPAATAVATSGYRVRAGDTLLGVAGRLGVDPARLAAANGIADPDRIVAGQVLVVPAASSSGGSRSSGSYRVRPGDTLADLAPRLGVSQRRLATANSLADPDRIFAGDTLVIPATAGTRAGAGPSPAGPALPTGRWGCPVPGAAFVDDFGYVKPDGQRHEGVDLYAPRGTPVVAPVSGVASAFPNHLGGRAVHLVGDDGNRYYGAHLDRYGRMGRVAAGAVIGYVGNSGDAVGGPTHLHFEVHPGGGSAVSPYPLLARACR